MGVLRRTQRRRQSVEPRAVRGWGPAGRKQDPKSQKFSLKDSLELVELLLSSALRVSARFPSKPRGEAAFRPAPSFSHCVRHPRVCLSYPQFPVASAGGAWVSAAPRAQGCLACPCPVASANLGSCPVQGRCIPRTPQLGLLVSSLFWNFWYLPGRVPGHLQRLSLLRRRSTFLS